MLKAVLTLAFGFCFACANLQPANIQFLQQHKVVADSMSSMETNIRESTANVNCRAPETYDVKVNESESRTVDVLTQGGVVASISAPWQDKARISGFSLNWAKKTQDGFEISIDYGSRYYFDKKFTFTCRNGEFLLTKIEVESFDKQNPEKWSKKKIRIKPPMPLSQFSIMKFISD